MRRVRSLAATVASATVLAGCALLSGAADLTVGGAAAPDDGRTEAGAIDDDGGTMSDGAFSGADARAPGDAGADAEQPLGDASARLREVTFEDGTLLGIHGGDTMFGSPFLQTGLSALSGKTSMRVDNGVAGIEVDFAAQHELYGTMLVRFQNVDLGASTLLTVVPEPGGAVAELTLPNGKNGPFALAVAGNVVANGSSIDQSQVLRFGFHVRDDATAGFVEIFVAAGAAPFGPPAISAATSKLGRPAAVRIGSLAMSTGGGNNIKVVYDDLFLDSASLPVLP